MFKKISEYAKNNNVQYRTVWNWVKAGKIPYKRLPSGTLLVDDSHQENESINRVILYARVSSSENKDNLEKQLDRLRDFASAKGYSIVKECKEVGSGLNDKRKILSSILKDDDSWDIILVEHKDRLARFGVSFLEILLNNQEKRIEIINTVEENSREDIMQDFVSIITSFTAQLYGLRRSKRKTEKLIEDLENDTSK
jgi:predicted site-specific integrase-resolvase